MDIKYLKDFMKKKFDLSIEADLIGEETILLYHEELDKSIFSDGVLNKLPNPVLFQTYIYEERSEWIISVAYKKATDNPLFLVCLKDGDKVYEEAFI